MHFRYYTTVGPTSPCENRRNLPPCLSGVLIIYFIVYTYYGVYATHDGLPLYPVLFRALFVLFGAFFPHYFPALPNTKLG